MIRGTFVAVVAALALGIVVAGCGSSDSDDSSSAQALTKAEFVKRGNALCRKAEAKKNVKLLAALKELGNDVSKQSNQEKLVVEIALPPVAQMTKEFSELVPPAGDEEEIEKIVSAYEASVKQVEADPGSAIIGTVEPFLQPDRDAVAYGMQACRSI